MTDFESFKLYNALKAHFSTTYDFFKYNGKMKSSSYDTFLKRNDKLFFMKLAKHPEVQNFLVANFLENPKVWIKNLAYNSEAEKIYNNWTNRIQSLTYNFKNDINTLSKDIPDEIRVESGKHPKLLSRYLQKTISLETFIILLDICNAFTLWDEKMKEDIIWKEMSFQLKKYRPFLDYDQTKMKNILFNYVKSA
jgi:hypothetical protein